MITRSQHTYVTDL